MRRANLKETFKQPDFKDLGLGTKADQSGRAMNKDGSFNVRRTGLSIGSASNTYHWLVSISWLHFTLLLFLGFTLINVFFATLYIVFGIEYLSGVHAVSDLEKFFEAFFFSTQTFTTVGYGRISPVGFTTSLVASLESLIGLLTFAIGTGLLYGRFSRPNANILFSENALIAPYQGMSSFQLRLVNARNNQLIEVEASINLSFKLKNDDGSEIRKFHNLKLERDKISLFPTNWTLVHPIDETSPLFDFNKADLDASQAEFFVIVKAFDDTFSQTVYSRTSYSFDEVVYGAKFVSMVTKDDFGSTILELAKLNNHVEIGLMESQAPFSREVTMKA
ncbi:MAG TPA: ion channel [Cytophagaceae bacterium]|jgi:inward rectifier potassium channel